MRTTSRTTRPATPTTTTAQVWEALRDASFLVLAYVTPDGQPRSSGVVYQAIDGRLYVPTAPGSWKARHLAPSGPVAVTVPVRRGGLLALLAPIPPATISFHGTATVHPAGAPEVAAVLDRLGALLPEERRGASALIEIVPQDTFVTYGIGVSLGELRDPAVAGARVPVG